MLGNHPAPRCTTHTRDLGHQQPTRTIMSTHTHDTSTKYTVTIAASNTNSINLGPTLSLNLMRRDMTMSKNACRRRTMNKPTARLIFRSLTRDTRDTASLHNRCRRICRCPCLLPQPDLEVPGRMEGMGVSEEELWYPVHKRVFGKTYPGLCSLPRALRIVSVSLTCLYNH